uniref:DENN domain containing 3 n=1 Tax=Labrus bergylta TaxID=56723 RepID=A0A3Q3GDZ0_9LABR
NGTSELPLLEPEVLHVLAPPFFSRPRAESESLRPNGKKRRAFLRKKKEKPPSSAGTSSLGICLSDFLHTCHSTYLQMQNICAAKNEDEQFHFLVFTDVFGNKSHGVVMQCYRPILVHVILHTPSHSLFSAYSICVISKYPYFTALKDCLSCLLIQLRTCPLSDMEGRVREFAAKLALVPIPPPGTLHLMFTLRPLTIVLPSREDKDHVAIDLDLHLPFLCFRPQQLLQVLHTLVEQQVVLFSADWARLTLMGESLLLFLQPLSWQQPYVPVLARSMLDFLMAPTAFLMGCHLSHFQEVADEIDDLILINIDKGSVTTSHSETLGLPEIPQAAAECFIQRYSEYSLRPQRAMRRAWQHNLNHDIQRFTLELIVNIFRDVGSHLNYEHRVFNSEEFLKSREPSEQLFYKKVLETHIFHFFLKDRLNRKMDDFARMELITRSETQKMKALVEVPRRPTMQEIQARRKSSVTEKHLSKRLGMSLPNLRDDQAVSFQKNTLFYYLRGFINTLCSRRLDALSDFQNLYKTDTAIFPTQLVTWLVDSLHRDERHQANPELKRLILKVIHGTYPSAPDDHVKKFELPRKSLHQEEFVRCVQECGIIKDMATIHRLFDALSNGQPKHVDHELFKLFYSFWKDMEAEAKDPNLPSEVIDHLGYSECVYKLSSCVKTSHGVGKIAMTQKRLFLLTEGKPGFLEITNFRNIQEVRISTAPFLLVRVPSLRIQTSSRPEVFEANLKTEAELWNLVVKEMWAGRKMADQHKDPHYMTQALTNVLLMDAVVGCLQTQRPIIAASKLAYFDQIKQKVPIKVSQTTSDTLKHKINPSLGLAEPQTVHVLLYTPGQLTSDDSKAVMNPKLWVALSGGKLVVFDAASWSMLQDCIEVGQLQLNCMLGMEGQVWIGSQDSVIYIIDTHSMSCNKQLTEHRHEVTGLTAENRQTYSCSSDGTILQWDSASLKVKRNLHLSCDFLSSIQIYDGTLCSLPMQRNHLTGEGVSSCCEAASQILSPQGQDLYVT